LEHLTICSLRIRWSSESHPAIRKQFIPIFGPPPPQTYRFNQLWKWYHISFARAIGRRLRRTYSWIFVIQAIAYYGKLAIHPVPLSTITELWERAAIGPIPGGLVVAAGVLFHGGWAVFAFVTHRVEVTSRRKRGSLIAMG
jgi:uncharacterized membrane protein